MRRRKPSCRATRVERTASSPVFEQAIEGRWWGSDESSSGVGSELRFTEAVRSALPALFAELRVRSLLDIPCGDWNWMRHVDLTGVDYTGADVVPSLVAEVAAAHARPGVRFECLDVAVDRLPRADLVLVRDCLVHFPDALVHAALANVAESRSKYLLSTTFPEHANGPDIALGEWRPINLEVAPYRLGPPRVLINERYTGDRGRYLDKSLGLWAVRDVRRAFRRRSSRIT